MIVECHLTASSVVITDLLENTFYALIELVDENDTLVSLDARPSDAIALALRLDCPIFVEQKVLDLSAATNQGDAEPDGESLPPEEWPDLIG